ncbi:ABC-type transport system involved in multi-copper enzyme maturation, permease component [Mariniphaga anaerophila]|uniref:ABC-type transport system involved in multi-copper enzyme maturation, permease component n=1 Tax=Mariniphaga anaerophila TaxID=1484053 RepID=A0A1M5BPA1_9BACT|nr:hypothetical protein [Mariniphaga anaerophila]SHF44261.1 ABC-type transport system involved in multi-copper enzyme maturation, permease component [Mariniphaga anaerophila]
MISLHNIFSIAKYERKTLLRSWFFRIFSILSLLVLFGLNFGMIIEGGGDQGWAVRSIPAAIPYFNLLILNVAQAIIAVFLASDFLKRDKKLDTTEVIYMRSMTNGEYVIGKTWGNLQVFLVLNIAVVGMALIFNMLSQQTAINWASYGIYLVLISVPTLVFIMGLSFFLMSVIRNQAITFVLILGYIGITLFLLEARFYYIFDYMAFNIPMLISDIAGMGNLEKVLIHRGIYFSFGMSFIFLTIFLLKRLPQSEGMTWFSLIFALLFFGAGGYFAYEHINQFKTSDKLRSEAIALNNIYVKEKLPAVLEHSIKLNHNGSFIEATSEITVENDNAEPLNKLIFNLNEGLQIQSFKLNGQEIPFERKNHLIVSEDVLLQPAQKADIEITYSGKVDETLCYLDIPEEERTEKYGKFVLNVDKRYAFLTPDYVLLTPESNWYPCSGVTYSTDDVSWNHPEFVRFSLDVKTRPGLQAISQGEITKTAEGEFSFKNSVPLTQLSLAIGNYEKKNIETDSLEYGIWHIKGHDYFTESFPETKDTLAQLVNERMGDFERAYNLDYAFNRFFLVEVPAQFKTYERIWSGRQELIQPEQILIPEKGYLLREADFEGSKKRMERWGRRGDNNMTDKDKEIRLLYDFMRIFTREQSADFQHNRGNFTVSEVPNPYFAFAMLYNFQNNIVSDEWAITNRIFEAYLKSQSTDMRSGWMRNMQGMSDDELANIALQDSTFQEILADPKQKKIIDNVIKLKGEVLFSMVQWTAGQDEFEEFLRKVLMEYRFKNITFEQFDQTIKEKFDIELIPMMDEWFKAKTLPGFLFSPIEAVKVKTGDRMQTKISFKVTNFSDTEGIVKISFRMGGGGPGRGRPPGGDDMENKLVYLGPQQTKDVSYMFDTDPRMVMVNTMTSKNIPQVITEGFRDVKEDPKAVPVEGEVVSDTPVQKQMPGEIIVDNEDPQFEYTVTEEISLLEKWLAKDTEGVQKYSGMNYWRPPINWTATTNSDFFGEYVRSAYYIKGGDGSMKAKWNVPIEDAGYYDVYYHVYKPRRFGRGGNEEKGDYQFFIHGDDGTEEQLLGIQSADEGWNHLGSYYFSPDTALIELTNKTDARIVFADAVRLVKL